MGEAAEWTRVVDADGDDCDCDCGVEARVIC